MSMLGHLSFGVSDLERSIAFYDAALAPLGLTRVWTKPNAAGYGPPGGGDLLALKKQSSAVKPPGLGFHLAFNAVSHAAVDTFHSEACGPVEPITVVLGFDRIMGRPTTRPL